MKHNKILSILMASICLTAFLSLTTVAARPLQPNPDGVWPVGAIWGTVLHYENTDATKVSEAWFGAKTGADYSSDAAALPGTDWLQVTLWNYGTSLGEDYYVKTSAASYSWYVKMERGGTGPQGGTISSKMDNVDDDFIPQEYSVVLENSSVGIFVNLRNPSSAGSDNVITGLPKNATLTIENAVNMSISPGSITGATYQVVTYTVTINNTGSRADSYTLSATDTLGATIGFAPNPVSVSASSSNTSTMSVTLKTGVDNITVKAAGTYATAYAKCTATGMPIGLQITPLKENGWTGDHLFETITVTNLGATNDNFIIEITDPLMWTVPWDNAGYLSGLTDPIISELIEGTGNNKALEIYNPTSSPIDLSLYQLCLYSNGGCEDNSNGLGGGYPAISDSDHQLTGMLAPYKTYVIVDNLAVPGLLAYANLIDNTAYVAGQKVNPPIDNTWIPGSARNKVTAFNGDDGTVLRKIADNSIVDSIGWWKVRPTNASWAGWTLDQTDVRKDNIKVGDTNFTDNDWAPDNANSNFGNNWTAYSTNTYKFLGWHDALGDYNKVIQLGAGENWTGQIQVVVGGTPCTTDNITLKVTSENDPTKSANATCQAHHAVAGVDVTINPLSKSGTGDTTFTVTVKNTGDNLPDNYKLENSGTENWALSLDNVVLGPIPVGENRTTTLHVYIENNPGITDNVTVKATSVHDNTVSGENSCQAIGPVRGVSVSISPSSKSGANGATLTYTVTVNNTGNVSDNYILTDNDSAGWSPSLLKTSIEVAPGTSDNTTTLSVTIPSDAIGGTVDNIKVTATSQTDNTVSGSGNCTAQVTTVPTTPVVSVSVSVSVSPSEASAVPGKGLSYTITVMNTGSARDTFDLSVSGGTGWSQSISPSSITLDASASGGATLTVTVPSWAVAGATTTITVTATSRADPTISSSASCKATATAPTTGPGLTPTPTGASWVIILVIAGAIVAIIVILLVIIFI